MSGKDSAIAITTNFHFQCRENNLKCSRETSVDLTLRNHYRARHALNICMSAKSFIDASKSNAKSTEMT